MLFFDCLSSPSLKSGINSLRDLGNDQMVSDLEFLLRNNLVIDIDEYVDLKKEGVKKAFNGLDELEREKLVNKIREGLKINKNITAAIESFGDFDDIDIATNLKIKELIFQRCDIQDRISSITFEKLTNFTAVPLVQNQFSFESNLQGESLKKDVIEMIINRMPTPDKNTPWERIIDFKSDSDSKSKFLELKNWLNEVATISLKPSEVEEKLEYLLNQYERHMQFHKMKCHKGILETIVTTTAETAEDLVKLKWGQMAKSLFSIKNKKLYLMEEEMKAPGREVAYISKAREHFS